MIFDIAKGFAATALAAACMAAPVMAHAQSATATAAESSVKAEASAAPAKPAEQQAEAAANAEEVDASKGVADGNGAESAGDAKASGAAASAATAESAGTSGTAGDATADDAGVAEQPAEPVAAATPEQRAANVKAAFEAEFPGISLDGVRPTRFAGLYELRIGSDLLYTNEQVDYVLQGALIDARNKEDLTAKRMDELMRVAWNTLPLESAIKQVKGDGSRKMVVFEDPNCGYCKRLHQTLEGMDNYTVYTLLFPILSPDSTAKARNIWCAPDRVQAWRDQMLKNQAPPDAQCETPIEANLAFGRKLLVRGTPAIFFEDGSRVNGALPRESLEQRLDAATAAVAAAGVKD